MKEIIYTKTQLEKFAKSLWMKINKSYIIDFKDFKIKTIIIRKEDFKHASK